MARTDLLRQLADFIEQSVPPERFNMQVWATGLDLLADCGTSACAMGWASVLWPHWIKVNKLRDSGGHYLSFPVNHTYHVGFLAIAEFFQINEFEATPLFLPSPSTADNSPRSVVQRIRYFAAQKDKSERRSSPVLAT